MTITSFRGGAGDLLAQPVEHCTAGVRVSGGCLGARVVAFLGAGFDRAATVRRRGRGRTGVVGPGTGGRGITYDELGSANPGDGGGRYKLHSKWCAAGVGCGGLGCNLLAEATAGAECDPAEMSPTCGCCFLKRKLTFHFARLKNALHSFETACRCSVPASQTRAKTQSGSSPVSFTALLYVIVAAAANADSRPESRFSPSPPKWNIASIF
ncbi:hypothetical protein B0H21DRAFT_754559 [Amylocystis lapponica]|nr:hypothetical protein B0H21DRAFT_754559 [Amylocystis lapponica]